MNSNLPAHLLRQLQAAQEARRAQSGDEETAHFKNFSASELYCAKCKRAMPVREKLLLSLPGGDMFDYICTGCGSSLGTKQ
jgi:uncharacterized protein YbaR (Trm112 family)